MDLLKQIFISIVIMFSFTEQAMERDLDNTQHSRKNSIGLEDSFSEEVQVGPKEAEQYVQDIKRTLRKKNKEICTINVTGKAGFSEHYRILHSEDNYVNFFSVYRTKIMPIFGEKSTRFDLLEIKKSDFASPDYVYPYAYFGETFGAKQKTANALNEKAKDRFMKIEMLYQRAKNKQAQDPKKLAHPTGSPITLRKTS